jgi:rare lipoprotein A
MMVRIKLVCLSIFTLFIMVFSCTYSNVTKPFKQETIDGIIFLDQEEPGQKEKKKAEGAMKNGKDEIAAAEAQGIVFLDFDNQVYEMSGLPLDLRLTTQRGKASYYDDSLAGKRTASGEIYDPKKLTAAHRTLPFGTRVRVTNLFNDKSVIVRINDRGPFVKSRIIDLSRAAAERLDMIDNGVVEVFIEVIQ